MTTEEYRKQSKREFEQLKNNPIKLAEWYHSLSQESEEAYGLGNELLKSLSFRNEQEEKEHALEFAKRLSKLIVVPVPPEEIEEIERVFKKAMEDVKGATNEPRITQS